MKRNLIVFYDVPFAAAVGKGLQTNLGMQNKHIRLVLFIQDSYENLSYLLPAVVSRYDTLIWEYLPKVFFISVSLWDTINN